MNTHLSKILILLSSLVLSGCSLFGNSGVEIAPYSVLTKEGSIEIRHYERLVLVTTPMPKGMEGQKTPFGKLFGYISGKNENTSEIAMTAPVFMDAPIKETETMSFVLPKDFTIETAPKPKDPAVKLEEIKDYTVATITFNGSLNQKNINENRVTLEKWLKEEGIQKIGMTKVAGYNPPFTIPKFKRNEILIPIEKKDF